MVRNHSNCSVHDMKTVPLTDMDLCPIKNKNIFFFVLYRKMLIVEAGKKEGEEGKGGEYESEKRKEEGKGGRRKKKGERKRGREKEEEGRGERKIKKKERRSMGQDSKCQVT